MVNRMPPPKRIHADRVLSVSAWVPAARTVLVSVWLDSDTGEPAHEFVPVVAFETSHTRSYNRPFPGSHLEGEATHAELLRSGWRFTGEEVRHRPLVAGDGGEVEAYDPCKGEAVAAVPCYWPCEEDERRLADVVRRLTAEAERMAEDSGATVTASGRQTRRATPAEAPAKR